MYSHHRRLATPRFLFLDSEYVIWELRFLGLVSLWEVLSLFRNQVRCLARLGLMDIIIREIVLQVRHHSWALQSGS